MDTDDFPDGARVGADPAAPATRPREPTASSGFGSPGSDFTVKRIDLNEALIRHPQATFVMRASGDAMASAGICNGDVLLVDRAVAASHDRQHSPSTVVPLRPTSDSRHLVGAATAAAAAIFRRDFNYVKAGVMLLDLQQRAEAQRQPELDLFSEPAPEQAAASKDRSPLMQAMDTLNRRFGRGAVRIGSATTAAANDAGAASWAVRQERWPPRYTTRWSEMPQVKC